MSKFGICFQWRSEYFKAKMFFFSLGNGAMIAPRFWQLGDDVCTLYILRNENSANTPLFSYPPARWISWPRRQLRPQLPTSVRGNAEFLKGSQKLGDGSIFLKTSAPHSLMTTYRMNLLFRSISLDSNFKSIVSRACKIQAALSLQSTSTDFLLTSM